jgi:hypothetical protein
MSGYLNLTNQNMTAVTTPFNKNNDNSNLNISQSNNSQNNKKVGPFASDHRQQVVANNIDDDSVEEVTENSELQLESGSAQPSGISEPPKSLT